MAVAGGAMPALRVKLKDGTPVAEHSESRPLTAIQQDMEAAEATLRSGLSVWVPSIKFGDLRARMALQGALANVPPRQSVSPGTSGWGSQYLQLDDSPEAEGPPVYDNRTCAQRHDEEFQALKMEVELLGRRLERLESKLAQEQKVRVDLEAKLGHWEADS